MGDAVHLHEGSIWVVPGARCTSETARMTSASASRVSEGLEPGSVAMSRSACRCALGRARPAPFRRTQATCRHPGIRSWRNFGNGHCLYCGDTTSASIKELACPVQV